MTRPKQWTVLVWMAGDNDLEKYGVSGLAELKSVGSTPAIDVAVEFDRRDGATRRYHVSKDRSLEDDVVAELGETNTGDPACAIDFFVWGMQTYPSDRVLAVLWNHGSGIDEEDLFHEEPGQQHLAGSPRRALFSTTRDAPVRFRSKEAFEDEGIGYDYTNADFLDNAELQRVLSEVTKQVDRTIDIVGFDACFMNMVEVAYQLRGCADLMVGSEEEEPGGGWPYGRIICDLATVPGMTPRALAKKIVQRYVASYPATKNVALSALDLSRLEHVTPAVDRFAAACIGALRKGDEHFFTDALKAVQRFKRRWDFIDVVDFARQVRARSADGRVQRAADALVDVMLDGPKPFVIANGSKGDRVSGAHGAAIYFPAYGDVTVAYPQLDFADATHWDDLIATYRSK